MELGISESSARLWDAVTKVIAAVGVISGGLWTLKKYFDDRANERDLARERAKSAEVEARKPFSSKQLDLYLEAVRIAGLIAASSNDRDEAERAFWSLYLGPLSLVEDGRVAAAMVNFGTALNKGASRRICKSWPSRSLTRAGSRSPNPGKSPCLRSKPRARRIRPNRPLNPPRHRRLP
jgi:hypothetical protein